MSKVKIMIAKLAIVGLFLLVSTVNFESTLGRTLAAPPAPQAGCPLGITGITGDVSAFTVTGSGTTTLQIVSIAFAGTVRAGMASVVAGPLVNASVTISPFTVGTIDPISVSAAKIDPSQAASFTVVATDTVGHTITIIGTVDCPISLGCTLTQGFWKNHPEDWPVQSLTLGTVTYTKAQLLAILKTPVRGNGLVSLSHQLIAAKLNLASGASAPASVASAIAAADALIGALVVPPIGSGFLSTSSTSTLTSTLDSYNNGLAAGGPPHCDN